MKIIYNIAESICMITGEKSVKLNIRLNKMELNKKIIEWYTGDLYTDKRKYLIRDDGTVDIKEE